MTDQPSPDAAPGGSESSRRRGRTGVSVVVGDLEQRLARLGAAMGAFQGALADHLGLTATELDCLDQLAGSGPLTPGDLGRRLGLTSGAVTALVDRLEARRWVERRPDPSDGRRVLVGLRADRHAAVADLHAGISRRLRALVTSSRPEALAAIADALGGLGEVYEAEAASLRATSVRATSGSGAEPPARATHRRRGRTTGS